MKVDLYELFFKVLNVNKNIKCYDMIYDMI